MSDAVAASAAALLGVGVTRAVRVSGGDLNDAYRLELADGRGAFAKTSPDAAPGAFRCEAAALRWLAGAGALALPEVLAAGDALLVLAWVEEAGRAPGFDEALGRGLARLHGAGADAFGATGPGTPGGEGGGPPPTVLGPLVLPNDAHATWAAFYGACRIAPVARLAAERGALPAGATAAIERLLGRLEDLLGPPEPPARLHGDLWGGNVLAGPGGEPWLIDPAAYGGHREVDLAMLALFGGARPRLRAAYEEVAPLAPGYADREALHQLFGLLVHAALFGGGYGASAARIAERYAG